MLNLLAFTVFITVWALLFATDTFIIYSYQDKKKQKDLEQDLERVSVNPDIKCTWKHLYYRHTKFDFEI